MRSNSRTRSSQPWNRRGAERSRSGHAGVELAQGGGRQLARLAGGVQINQVLECGLGAPAALGGADIAARHEAEHGGRYGHGAGQGQVVLPPGNQAVVLGLGRANPLLDVGVLDLDGADNSLQVSDGGIEAAHHDIGLAVAVLSGLGHQLAVVGGSGAPSPGAS